MIVIGVGWMARRLRRLAGQFHDGIILMGRAAWRGVHEVAFGSDDLTHAAAIAYYALLSFLPFLLLSMSVLGAFAGGSEARSDVLNSITRWSGTSRRTEHYGMHQMAAAIALFMT